MNYSGLMKWLYDFSYLTENLDYVVLVFNYAMIDHVSQTLLLEVLEDHAYVLGVLDDIDELHNAFLTAACL